MDRLVFRYGTTNWKNLQLTKSFQLNAKIGRVNGPNGFDRSNDKKTVISGEWLGVTNGQIFPHGPWAQPLSPCFENLFWSGGWSTKKKKKVEEWEPFEIRCLVDYPCFPSKPGAIWHPSGSQTLTITAQDKMVSTTNSMGCLCSAHPSFIRSTTFLSAKNKLEHVCSCKFMYKY